jgi:hypothetical protein
MTAPDLTPARLEKLLATVSLPLDNRGRTSREKSEAIETLIALYATLSARVIELEQEAARVIELEAEVERLRLASASRAALVIDVEGADQDGAMVTWEYTATGMRFTIRGALAAAIT